MTRDRLIILVIEGRRTSIQPLTKQAGSGSEAQDYKLEELVNGHTSDSSRVTNSEKQLVR